MKPSFNYRSKLVYICAVAAAIAFTGVLASAQVFAPAKAATINSDAFLDQKTGITRLVKAMATIDAEFKQRHDEIDALFAQLDAVNKTTPPSGVPDAKTAADKSAQIARLQADIKKKQQEGQAALDTRTKDLTDPIYADLMTSLEAFAKKRGIDVVLDLSKTNGLYIFNKGVDVTVAFIAEYNAKPATP